MKKLLFLTLLMSYATYASPEPYYIVRKQSESAEHELISGWNAQINLLDKHNWYGSFSITPEPPTFPLAFYMAHHITTHTKKGREEGKS